MPPPTRRQQRVCRAEGRGAGGRKFVFVAAAGRRAAPWPLARGGGTGAKAAMVRGPKIGGPQGFGVGAGVDTDRDRRRSRRLPSTLGNRARQLLALVAGHRERRCVPRCAKRAWEEQRCGAAGGIRAKGSRHQMRETWYKYTIGACKQIFLQTDNHLA